MVTTTHTRLGSNPLNLTVHNNDYTQRLQIGSYIDCELNQEHGFNAGQGTLRVPADHPLARRIMQADRDVVPITASNGHGWMWTGRVDTYEATGKPGREIITAQLVDDKIQLAHILAPSSPKNSLAIQGKYDRQRGRLEEVCWHYLSTNLARAGLPSYVMLPPPANRDTSPRVDAAARMTSLDVLLREMLDQHDYDVTATMWWPGEPIPAGKMVALTSTASENYRRIREAELDQTFHPDSPSLYTPDRPGLIVDVKPIRDRKHVRFSTNGGDVVEFKLSGRSPGPARAVVGGRSDDWVNELLRMAVDAVIHAILIAIGGAALGPIGMAIGAAIARAITSQVENTLFAFTDRKDVRRAAEMGPFHLRENFTPSNAGVFTLDTQALAERALVDAKGGQAIEVTIADGVSKVLGDDQVDTATGKIRHGYQVGDRVQFYEHLSDVIVSDIITGVTVTDSPGERLRVTPRVGKRKNTSSPFLDFTQMMSKLVNTQRDMSMME